MAALSAARVLLGEPGIAGAEIAAVLQRAQLALGLAPDPELARLSEAEAPASRATRALLKRHLRRLRTLARSQTGGRFFLSGPGGQVLRWSGGGLLLGALLVGALLLGERAQMGWRASYYPRQAFRGEPVVQHDLEIAYRWKEKAPLPSFPRDGFSVRWESCLVLESDQTLAFRLGSDDGSRLWIEGEQVIDNWRVQGFHWEDGARALSAGRHRVKIEYFEKSGSSGMVFETHAGGLDGETLSPRIYRLPDADGGCG